MKTLFIAIRRGDIEKVKILIDKDKSLVNSIAKAPPKKDNGQSALQVSIKSANFLISHFLIDSGANVNFIETPGSSPWTAPVLHDAIRATIFSSFNPDLFELAFSCLKKLVEKGANPNSTDSFGNTSIMRATLDAHQLNFNDDHEMSSRIERISRVFECLYAAGAKTLSDNQQQIKNFQQFTKKPWIKKLLGL